MAVSALYLRKSRADEANEAVEITIGKHKKMLEAFAARNGIKIARVYEEVATGDSLFVRPQMLQLLADVEKGLYESVVCMDIDRLGRGDMRDQGIILQTFKYSGTKIATPEKIYDLDNELDEELTELKSFMSRRELKIITKRMQRGLMQVVKEGAYIANAPYGYDKTVVSRKPTLKINEQEAYFVRMIFDLYVREAMGCERIACHITNLGARPRRSEAFGRSSIMHILRNPVYIGKIAWNRTQHIRKGKRGNETHQIIEQPAEKWIVCQGLHPPIIDRDTWSRAQEIIKGRYHPPKGDGTIRNPLAGIVRCAKCGARMQVYRSREHAYLRCLTRGCTCTSCGVEYVERSLFDHLEPLFSKLRPNAFAPRTLDTAALERTLAATRRSIAAAQAQKNRLCDLLEQDIYTAEEYQTRTKAVGARIAALRRLEMQQLHDVKAATSQQHSEQNVQPKTLADIYNTADAHNKNRLLKQAVDTVLYNKEPGSLPAEFELKVMLK